MPIRFSMPVSLLPRRRAMENDASHSQLHAHPVQYVYKLASTKRAIENKHPILVPWEHMLQKPSGHQLLYCTLVLVQSCSQAAVRSGGAISIDDFSADLRCRLQGVWKEAEFVDFRGNNNKLATYQAWFATPFACNARQTYIPLPWDLFLDFLMQVMRNVSRFRLRAHTLKVESAVWQDGTSVCERCSCNQT
eukprot:1160800-Pelagomonas_calceolata.AAC.7